MPFVLVPNAQEISGFQCDLGWNEAYVKSSAPKLISEAAPGFDERNLDMKLVDESWNSKVSFKSNYCTGDIIIHQTKLDCRKVYTLPHYRLFVDVLLNCDAGSGVVRKNTSL